MFTNRMDDALLEFELLLVYKIYNYYLIFIIRILCILNYFHKLRSEHPLYLCSYVMPIEYNILLMLYKQS